VTEKIYPSHSKKDRGKRLVVFIIVGYFQHSAKVQPDWKIITDFLEVTGLTPESTSPKRIATWWSNIAKRESHGDDLKEHQKEWNELFEHVKAEVHGL
jgi:hypothetical protein